MVLGLVVQLNDTLLQPFDKLLVVLQPHLRDFLHEALNVAHAQQLLHERLHLERLEIVDMFASTNEDDR